MGANENDPQLTAKIVSKYVSHHKLTANQLPELINLVYRAIDQLGTPVQPEEDRTPAVSVLQSVRHNYVVCLDCGFQAKILRRHIRVRHGLSPHEYRQRWGLKSDHPLTAPAYSERRSSVAKALGLGRTPATEATPEKSEVASAAMTSKPVRKARGATKQAEAIEAAVGPSKPARAGRSRRSTSANIANG